MDLDKVQRNIVLALLEFHIFPRFGTEDSLHNKMTDLLIYKAKHANSLPLTRSQHCAPSGGVANTWHRRPLLYPQPEEMMRPQTKNKSCGSNIYYLG